MCGGEGGIRTPGRGLPANGFQDRRIRPLCHLSGACILSSPPVQRKTLGPKATEEPRVHYDIYLHKGR